MIKTCDLRTYLKEYYYILFIHFGVRLQGRVSGFSCSRHTPVASDIMQHAERRWKSKQRDVLEDGRNRILHFSETENNDKKLWANVDVYKTMIHLETYTK